MVLALAIAAGALFLTGVIGGDDDESDGPGTEQPPNPPVSPELEPYLGTWNGTETQTFRSGRTETYDATMTLNEATGRGLEGTLEGDSPGGGLDCTGVLSGSADNISTDQAVLTSTDESGDCLDTVVTLTPTGGGELRIVENPIGRVAAGTSEGTLSPTGE